jgi:D-glycero-D-manno-heptose 1,7-bisphosphate phosphatase
MSTAKKKAVFLDRDNTLIEDPGYISHPSQVKLLPGTAASISQLRKMDFLVIVVSNQSGVARGIVTEEVLAQIHHQLEKLLADEGAFLDGIYFCPFHPDGVIAKYRMESELRKPAAGMLLKAAEDLNIDLSCCWMIGDSYRDIGAGQRAGCKTILINNPVKPVTKNPSDPVPDRQAVNIREAVNIIRMYELRQSMETTQEHKLNDHTETQAPQEIAVSAASDSAAPVVTTAPRTETLKAPSVQKSNEQAIEDIANKMKPYEQALITPSANNGLKATPALTPEILADPLHKETDWPGQQQPSLSVKSITPAEPVKPKTVPAPSAEDSRTEKLLQELLSHLRSVHRSRQYEDFTISKVAAAAAQVLAIACLVVSLWPFIDSTRSSDWTGIMLGYAAVLQLMAMAFYMMRER